VRRRKRKRLVRNQALCALSSSARPGVGNGLYRGRPGDWVDGAHPQRGRSLQAQLPGVGSRHQPWLVTRVLERLIERHGRLKNLRSDDGPEFTTCRMLGWVEN
jgi:hypothetical protein